MNPTFSTSEQTSLTHGHSLLRSLTDSKWLVIWYSIIFQPVYIESWRFLHLLLSWLMSAADFLSRLILFRSVSIFLSHVIWRTPLALFSGRSYSTRAWHVGVSLGSLMTWPHSLVVMWPSPWCDWPIGIWMIFCVEDKKLTNHRVSMRGCALPFRAN